jgi:hypothetical protein
VSVDLAVLVPVLARPHRVAPLLDALAASTPDCLVVFVCDPDDLPERQEVARQQTRPRPLRVAALSPGGGYAQKINQAVRATREPLLFLAADDLDFRPGWLPAARAHLDAGAQVVGVNDLIERRPGREGHATHFLVTREYAESPTIDGRPGPLCELYDHSFVDDELIGTATRRGVYAYAPDAHVAHVDHPMTGGADDATYQKGRAHFRQDRKLFARRRPMWTG